jgi:preprotein translocase subunit YajC
VDPVILILLFAVAAFYFILLRPVLNQQRSRRASIASLEVGDEVLTSSGFYAVIDEINTVENGPMEIVFELAEDVFVRGTPDAIVQVVGHEQPDDDQDRDAERDDGDDVEDVSRLDGEPSAGDDRDDEARERGETNA